MPQSLPANKTKLVCTIGPASADPSVMEAMLRAGMNVARLNFSHGDFAGHRDHIRRLRAAAERTGRRLAILADLPGPKIRIGDLESDRIELMAGQSVTLTTLPGYGSTERISVEFDRLPEVVEEGSSVFLSDGMLQLEVEASDGHDVRCRVRVGGELRSRKGLNLPGLDLGIAAFTDRDRECLAFALGEGVDAVSQSFVESAADVDAVREAARALGHDPLIIAKIERARALDRIDEIIAAADGIMIARGDLGVEIPVERIAGVQKRLLRKVNQAAKPVITATQMLESMTHSPLPTRAEATDVANAILDGTDAVMLSGESAMGRFPVDAVRMLARIAADIEGHRPVLDAQRALAAGAAEGEAGLDDLLGLSVESVFSRAKPAAVVVRTVTGATARSIARFRPPAWILAVTPEEDTLRHLQFSRGVQPVASDADLSDEAEPSAVRAAVREVLREYGIPGGLVLLAEGPSPGNPEAQARMGLMEL